LDLATTFLQTVNETLTAGNAIIAVSLLLFNLTRNLNNRVAKTSSIVLACVTIAYVVDSFISLGPDNNAHQMALRLQWIGIAFIPVAMLHLSDALLATTGLHSRGRRRRIIRILYLIAGAFLILVAFTDQLVQVVTVNGNVSIQANWVFILYVIYFFGANGFAFYNVQRARKRCLTHGTERRMAYLQSAILTPAIGIFPYSVLLNPGDEFSIFGLIVVNTANILIILMLVFLSYPLYFFGSDKADRLVKKQLLDFLLRGPATGIIALAVINFTAQASRIFSLPGKAFTPLAVVAAVLLWQWFVSLSLPIIEKFFIYRNEDDNQIRKLQTLNEKVLTHSDLNQLIKATIESICDYLRIDRAFVITFEHDEPEILQTIGNIEVAEDDILQNTELLQSLLGLDYSALHTNYIEWQGYALLPLFSSRLSTDSNHPLTIGILGLLNPNGSLNKNLQAETSLLQAFLDRVEQSLDDMQLQAEIYNVLAGLLPQFQMTRSRAEDVSYRQSVTSKMQIDPLPDREDLFEQVRAALRHYWGGSGITQSNLIQLHIIQQQIRDDADTPINALRKLLEDTINSLRPEGERKMMSPEWTLYNILQLRFIEKKRVRDVARRLSMSEADLYRKQRVAIETVADLILKQEQEIHP
jgi:hypothetical protein